jgi:hypothetical protein
LFSQAILTEKILLQTSASIKLFDTLHSLVSECRLQVAGFQEIMDILRILFLTGFLIILTGVYTR